MELDILEKKKCPPSVLNNKDGKTSSFGTQF